MRDMAYRLFDGFYTPKELLQDKRLLLSAGLSLLASIGIVYAVAAWKISSKVTVRSIATVSVTPWVEGHGSQENLSVDDIKKILESNTKIKPGERFVVYTTPLLEFCKNSQGGGEGDKNQLVIAKAGATQILGTIRESAKNCDVATRSPAAGSLLVTSPNPFPTAPYDKVLAVVQ
jgi:hypothetical protein